MTDRFVSDDGAITLILGDCRTIKIEADAVVTDPPYGIGRLMKGGASTGHWNQLSGGNEWDMEAPNLNHITDFDKVIIWGGNYFALHPSRCWLAWVKTNSVRTQADMELAWTNIDAPARVFESATGGSYARLHPTQKPVELMAWTLDECRIDHSATVFDPYSGSGTTAIACIRTGRKFIGIEISDEYFRIAVDRVKRELAQPMLIPPAAMKPQPEAMLL